MDRLLHPRKHPVEIRPSPKHRTQLSDVSLSPSDGFGWEQLRRSQTHTHTHKHTYMNIHTSWRPLRLYPGLSGVVDSVVHTLGAPEWIRVVELQQVDATAGVLVAAGVHLLVTVSPVHRHYLVHLRLPNIFLGLLPLTRGVTYTWGNGEKRRALATVTIICQSFFQWYIQQNDPCPL